MAVPSMFFCKSPTGAEDDMTSCTLALSLLQIPARPIPREGRRQGTSWPPVPLAMHLHLAASSIVAARPSGKLATASVLRLASLLRRSLPMSVRIRPQRTGGTPAWLKLGAVPEESPRPSLTKPSVSSSGRPCQAPLLVAAWPLRPFARLVLAIEVVPSGGAVRPGMHWPQLCHPQFAKEALRHCSRILGKGGPTVPASPRQRRHPNSRRSPLSPIPNRMR
jgi:hypothetical protein